MENDLKENIVEISDSNMFYYKIQYKGQNIESNIYYQKWKEQAINKNGNNSKIFKCSTDKVIFCVPLKEWSEFPYYAAFCPICKKYICYYCSRISTDSIVNGDCCIKRRFKCMIFQDGMKYINPIKEDNNNYISFCQALFWFLSPFGFGFIVQFFFVSLFYAFVFKKSLIGFYSYNTTNGSLYAHEIFLIYVIFISIPFTIFHMQFQLILLLISIPFSFYPIKFFVGMFNVKK